MGDENLSNILGWVSIACWIVVYSPQIYKNYQLKSGEGLSVTFILIWLLGDLCNLVGALLAGLLPTVILLALYYTFCDVVLFFQIHYYRWLNGGIEAPLLVPESDLSNEPGEDSPLLNGNSREYQEKQPPTRRIVAQYAGAFVFVIAMGIAGWLLNGTKPKDDSTSKPNGALEWKIQIIGWSSALLYLGARVPQIFKNFKTRCEGLSPALFVFAISGNLTYALSICAASIEREYLIMNASWLAGSALTVFLDLFVVCQFLYYRSRDRRRQRVGNTTSS